MNKSILLVVCDFLVLSLLSFVSFDAVAEEGDSISAAALEEAKSQSQKTTPEAKARSQKPQLEAKSQEPEAKA